MTDDLELRVSRIEAKEAICRLQYAYAAICDAGNNPDDMIRLFTDDAVWDSGERFGVHRGRDAIYTYFKGISGVIKWALHYMIQPVVDVADDLQSGHATWYLWQPVTVRSGDDDVPCWLTATYDVDYRLVDGEWKIAVLRLDTKTISPIADGWVQTPFVGF
jgi:hypothetical protein